MASIRKHGRSINNKRVVAVCVCVCRDFEVGYLPASWLVVGRPMPAIRRYRQRGNKHAVCNPAQCKQLGAWWSPIIGLLPAKRNQSVSAAQRGKDYPSGSYCTPRQEPAGTDPLLSRDANETPSGWWSTSGAEYQTRHRLHVLLTDHLSQELVSSSARIWSTLLSDRALPRSHRGSINKTSDIVNSKQFNLFSPDSDNPEKSAPRNHFAKTDFSKHYSVAS